MSQAHVDSSQTSAVQNTSQLLPLWVCFNLARKLSMPPYYNIGRGGMDWRLYFLLTIVLSVAHVDQLKVLQAASQSIVGGALDAQDDAEVCAALFK